MANQRTTMTRSTCKRPRNVDEPVVAPAEPTTPAAVYHGCPCHAHGPWHHSERMRAASTWVVREDPDHTGEIVSLVVYIRLPWCCSVPGGEYETSDGDEKWIVYFTDTKEWCAAPARTESPGERIQIGTDGVVRIKHRKVIPGHRLVCRFCFVTQEWIIEVRKQRVPVASDQPQQTTLTGICKGKLTFEKLYAMPPGVERWSCTALCPVRKPYRAVPSAQA